MEWLDEIPHWVWVAAVGTATSVALWWRRQASGLGFFQEAEDEQRDRVEELMRERIELLEHKVDRQEEEIQVYKDALNCGDTRDA